MVCPVEGHCPTSPQHHTRHLSQAPLALLTRHFTPLGCFCGPLTRWRSPSAWYDLAVAYMTGDFPALRARAHIFHPRLE